MSQESQENNPQQAKKKKSFTKRLLRFFIVIILLLIVGIGLLLTFINPIIKTSVSKIGPYFTGTPVTVGNVDLSIFNGSLALTNFTVGNPEGFQKPNIFELGSLNVKVNISSLFSDKMIVELVEIHDFDIDYELTVHGSNLDKIREHLEKVVVNKKEMTDGTAQPTDESPKAAKQVVIQKLIVDNGTLTLSNKTLGTEIPIPLVPIEMNNLGENSDNFAGTLNDFFTELMLSITSLVQGVDLQKIGQGLSDAAGQVGGTLNEGAANIGNAVTEGANKLTDGIGSLFGSDSNKQ